MEIEPIKSFETDSLTAYVYGSQSDLSKAAAKEVNKYICDVIASQGSATAILATGNSQIQFLKELLAISEIDWSKVTLFHMDEYLGLKGDHTASFRRYMRERVEEKVHPGVFHYLKGDALEPIKECRRYTNLLAAQSIDLCCLGVGENGHIAFNDPPVADFEDSEMVKIVQLDDACRRQQHGEGHFPTFEAVPQYALTLTIPALCQARKMICLCPETRKAEVVKRALEGQINEKCPVSYLRAQRQCVLYLDQDSASLLS
jgi:glucosamine-6-phosphate deaminase|tara:strand:+ start:319 stop:1095 length:777 start_codon:yes stop_codon:yes gene_type:complete